MNDSHDQIYDEFEKEKKDPTKKVVKTLDPSQILIFLFMVGLLAIGYFTKVIPKNWTIIFGFVIAGVFLFVIMKGGEDDQYVGIRQARAILNNELIWLQKERIIPEGKIFKQSTFQTQWIEGKPNKHIIKFVIQPRSGPEITYAGEIKAYGQFKGSLVGIKEYPEGLSGREAPDIMFKEDRVLKWMKEFDFAKYGGRK